MKTFKLFLRRWYVSIPVLLLSTLLVTGCSEPLVPPADQANNLAIPTLTTSPVSLVDAHTAISGGYVTSDGGSAVTSRGVCWSTKAGVTITDLSTKDGTGGGSFTSKMEGLLASTTYYVRAYAVNIKGTAYGEEFSFTTAKSQDEVPPPGTVSSVITSDSCIDADGNVYQAIKIGTQVWMATNLKTTHFNDGTPIPYIPDYVSLDSISYGGFTWFDNDPTKYKDAYGALYSYFVNQSRIAPKGWHIPSGDEWMVLVNYLGGANGAGGKLKEAGLAHWKEPNSGATNLSGFTALPGGYADTDYDFQNFHNYLGQYGVWLATIGTVGMAATDNKFYFNPSWVTYAPFASVRCVKN